MTPNSFSFDHLPLAEVLTASDFERWMLSLLDELGRSLGQKLSGYDFPTAKDAASHAQNLRERQTTTDWARFIDHTLLKNAATEADVAKTCEEALKYRFLTVCLNGRHIAQASQLLAGSSTVPISVVGFPLGAMSPVAKALETEQAIHDGAEEIDTVISIGDLKGSKYENVYDDIRAVVQAACLKPVKVIIEASALTHSEKVKACMISQAAGAKFVKTSTGFGSGGATTEDVKLMRRVVGSRLGVKASGGIKNFDDAERMLNAGANRIGTSSGVAIVSRDGNKEDAGYA